MAERDEPDIERVREAMREHDEWSEEEPPEPPAPEEPEEVEAEDEQRP